MSASEIITSHLSASFPDESPTLDLCPLQFHDRSPQRVWTANALRGAFGSTLKRLDADAYARFFTPTVQSFRRSEAGGRAPSGLRDLPRPFVFRLRAGEIGINLFLPSAMDLVRRVMAELGLELIARPLLQLAFAPPADVVDPPEGSGADRRPQRVRVRFLTPTELKGAREPEFGVLLARARDRISTLRELYGPGPLSFDFRAFGDRAAGVRMTRCELRTVTEERLSKGTGQRHAIGGFTGFAEYEGSIAEFLPYLHAARWTGVGRQTVWGKGEIDVEILRD